MELREEALSEALEAELIALSRVWAQENNCYGYRENGPQDLAGRRIFTARDNGRLLGYAFGQMETRETDSSVVPAGTRFFELEELYVLPESRNRGLGRALFSLVEESLKGETGLLLLSTAAKNAKAILHFYLDELGMEFWSARLYKRLEA